MSEENRVQTTHEVECRQIGGRRVRHAVAYDTVIARRIAELRSGVVK